MSEVHVSNKASSCKASNGVKMQLLHIFRRCDAGSKFGLLPYPALSFNTSQRLTTIKFFLNALGGDVSVVNSPCSTSDAASMNQLAGSTTVSASLAQGTVRDWMDWAVKCRGSAVFPLQESNLFSIPLTVQVDESSTDFTQWTVSNFVYCNQARTSRVATLKQSKHQSRRCSAPLPESCNSLLYLGPVVITHLGITPQGPFDTAAALLKAYRGGNLAFCNSPGWGKASFDFLPFTTIPFTPPTVNPHGAAPR